MDSLTHIVLGGCIGQVRLGKKIGRKAVVWGAIADTIPDLDVFYGLVTHPVDSLLSHRGFTHSVLFACLASLLLGWLLARWYRRDGIPWTEWALLMALGLFSHLLIDSLTNYGTGLWEPFCHHRFSYTTIFIADPAFTLPMLFAFVLSWFRRIPTLRKINIAQIALIISAVYLSWTVRNRWHFESYFKSELARQKIEVLDQSLCPAPLNNILWGTMARTDSGFYHGYHSLLGLDKPTQFHFIPQQEHLAIEVDSIREYALLRRFAKGYHCISLDPAGWPIFHDLRFGTATGWADTMGGFTFNYPLQQDTSRSGHLIRHNPWRTKWEGTRGLWAKIWGL
jgi:inner membrane protein